MVAETPLPNESLPAAEPKWRELLIDRIVELNPSAEHDFLERFREDALERYAAHLEAKLTPRGTSAGWVRTHETPAVTSWRAPKETIDRLW
ncbi:MAG: hypothetical protein AAGH64_02705 [Planctomycetota bacterium]